MIIYDILFIIFCIFAFPFLLVRGKLHSGYLERLGFIDKDKICKSSIWLHAVSVGEVLSAKELIKLLKTEFPDTRILITTITQTGNRVARDIAAPDAFVTYLPLDISFIIKNFINRFNPKIFIALETEIWPNLIIQLSGKKIPKIILNGRISKRSFKRYRIFSFLVKSILNKIDLLAMQTQEYATRALTLGVPKEKIEVSGNMKFDALKEEDTPEDKKEILSRLALKEEDIFFVAGSTHKGEEEIIVSVYKKAKNTIGNLRLLIAPRHIERTKEVENIVIKFGLQPVRISELGTDKTDKDCVFILDSLGALKDYYSVCSLAFVGGSLVAVGGHNILEPAYFAKPIIFGRYMHNFSDIKDLFLENNAAIVANDAIELEDSIRIIAKAQLPQVKNMGKKAKQIVDNNRGTTRRNIEIINKVLGAYGKLSL